MEKVLLRDGAFPADDLRKASENAKNELVYTDGILVGMAKNIRYVDGKGIVGDLELSETEQQDRWTISYEEKQVSDYLGDAIRDNLLKMRDEKHGKGSSS